MEKSIFKYIEFLLPIHNCVIIPEFGGFIVNIESATSLISKEINIPTYHIVFNPELKHNDGILASRLVKDENLSYNAASLKIKEFAKSISKDIKQGKPVAFGSIGTLTADADGNVLFVSNKNNIIHPALFGLSGINLQQLSEVERIANSEKRIFSIKYTIGSVAAAAAALLLFVTPSFDVNDNNHAMVQSAGFISGLPNLSTKEALPEADKKTYSLAAEEVKAPARTYYIIIGGEEVKNQANKLLKKNKQNFPKAAILETAGRYRIYVSSFDDKGKAERYLDTFRKENPKYSTAWLFSKKN